MPDMANYWLVMPAAGIGARMQADVPKQYLPLAQHQVIDWSLAPFIEDDRCQGIVVALAAGDVWWAQSSSARSSKIHTTVGGADRAASVLAGLHALQAQGVQANTWVLVHDAARPCLTRLDLNALLACAETDAVGALLAVPVADTLKRAGEASPASVLQTVPREGMWRALTPQMFRLGLLVEALQAAAMQARQVTDESSAIEAMQLQPRLVAGRMDNIKITVAEDLPLAEQILAAQRGLLVRPR